MIGEACLRAFEAAEVPRAPDFSDRRHNGCVGMQYRTAAGILPALMITLFSTIALSLLFVYSNKGKFYPAMPFITAGIFTGLILSAITGIL